VIIAYVLAGAMALLNCFAAAQIGTLLPAEGGSYVAISRLISPFYGFLTVWVLLVAVIVVNAFLAYGFAKYALYFFPQADKTVLALAVIVFFTLVNVFGSNAAVKFQSVLVIAFMIMLGIFIASGVPYFDSANLTPFVPNGAGSVLLAATMAYFSFGGFVLLLEIGGEIKNPAKNIPLGLSISFVIVMATYIGISMILTGINLDAYSGQATTSVLEIASITLPSWLADALVISIIAAAATTINSLIMGYSRDIFALAKVKLFPSFLARSSNKNGTPISSVVVFSLLSLLAVLVGEEIEGFVIITVIGLMIQQMLLAICLFRIPKVLADEYAKAEFKLSRPVILVVSVLLFIVSAAFILINIKENLSIVMIMVAVVLVGAGYYQIMTKYWLKRGVDIKKYSLSGS